MATSSVDPAAAKDANSFEDEWVRQAMAASLREAGAGSDQLDLSSLGLGGGARPSWGPGPVVPTVPSEDEDLQRALAASAADANRLPDEDAELQRALRESVGASEQVIGARRLMGPEGPFFPAGLLNSGNSCFWNALVQALFAATPVFRGALFQLDLRADAGGSGATGSAAPEALTVLCRLRDLFAEMDMGVAEAIDAGELYRTIFQTAEEADVSEQMQKLFELASKGPRELKDVCQELFSGDLYEHQRGGAVRRVPLELCQLNLCVTETGGSSLEQLLEEHIRDVQGNIEGRSYRLPPVLWLNLDRFVYDREAQRGRKRQVRLTFPGILNVWMLAPPDEPWVQEARRCEVRRQELVEALRVNRSELASLSAQDITSEGVEEGYVTLVEQQEALLEELLRVEESMARHGAEQELLYRLQAVIVHRGRVDSGHYYAYTRSPTAGRLEWACLNDAHVKLCTTQEMQRTCEGGEGAANEGAAQPSAQPATVESGLAADGGSQEASANDADQPAKVDVAAVAEPVGEESLTVLAVPQPVEPRRKVAHDFLNLNIFQICMGPNKVAEHIAPADEEKLPVAPERYPSVALSADVQAAPSSSSPGQGSSPAAAATERPPGPAREREREDFTAARCLVYVRSGVGGDAGTLLTEVRQRVSPALQEQIDRKNVEFLQQCAAKAAEDFTSCVRLLTSHGEPTGEDVPLREALQEASATARRIRAEGGMARARMYLLRACWRLHVPWLPEELCPTALPPDFRMHYGGTAKRALLDELIKRGQHDVASLIVTGTLDSDAFIPPEVEQWLASRHFP